VVEAPALPTPEAVVAALPPATEARDAASTEPAMPPAAADAALPPATEARDAASIEPAVPPATADPLPGATGSSNEPVLAKAEAEPAAATGETVAMAPAAAAAAPALPEQPAAAAATGETVVTAPAAAAAAAAPAPPEQPAAASADMPTADLVTLVWRGDRLLAAGEIVAARHFFERAAGTGDAGAACGAGKSYDPLFLRQLGVRGVAADPAKAIAWYRKAAAAGSTEAPALLERLLAAMPS
jgi:hypothetical protein